MAAATWAPSRRPAREGTAWGRVRAASHPPGLPAAAVAASVAPQALEPIDRPQSPAPRRQWRPLLVALQWQAGSQQPASAPPWAPPLSTCSYSRRHHQLHRQPARRRRADDTAAAPNVGAVTQKPPLECGGCRRADALPEIACQASVGDAAADGGGEVAAALRARVTELEAEVEKAKKLRRVAPPLRRQSSPPQRSPPQPHAAAATQRSDTASARARAGGRSASRGRGCSSRCGSRRWRATRCRCAPPAAAQHAPTATRGRHSPPPDRPKTDDPARTASRRVTQGRAIGVIHSCYSRRNGTPRQPALVTCARAELRLGTQARRRRRRRCRCRLSSSAVFPRRACVLDCGGVSP